MSENRRKLKTFLTLTPLFGSILSVFQIVLFIILDPPMLPGPTIEKVLTWNMAISAELIFRHALPTNDGDQIQALEGLVYAFFFGAVVNTLLLVFVVLLMKKTIMKELD